MKKKSTFKNVTINFKWNINNNGKNQRNQNKREMLFFDLFLNLKLPNINYSSYIAWWLAGVVFGVCGLFFKFKICINIFVLYLEVGTLLNSKFCYKFYPAD